MQPILALIASLLLKKVEGLENIPKGNFIVAANHVSNLDPPLLLYVFNKSTSKSFYFIAKKTLFIFPFNLLFNFYSIPAEGSIEKAIEILKEKDNALIIFPEGTRSHTGRLRKAHKGVAVIALKSRKPILPVAVKRTFKLWPPSEAFPKIKKIVEIKIGEPINLKGKLTPANVEGGTKRVMKEISKLSR